MKMIFLPFLFFIYLYPFALAVFPVGTRTLLAVIGFGVFFASLYKRKTENKALLSFILFVFAMLPFMFMSFLTAFINRTMDFEFLRLAFSFVLMYFAAYLLLFVLDNFNIEVSKRNVSELIVYAVLIQSVLSFFMYFSPALQNIVFTYIDISALGLMKMEALRESRIIGFSRSFFGAGIYSGLGLLILGYLLRYHADTTKKIVWFIFLFVIIFTIGMMMARTTIIGAGLSLVFIFLPKKESMKFSIRKSSIKKVLVFGLLPTLPVLLIVLLVPSAFNSIERILSFGFELFISVADGKGLQTNSTDVLMNMFKFPDTVETWLIGDGLWGLYGGMSYYMNTDVGYSRMVYYFGAIGLVCFLLFQAYLIKKSFGYSLFSVFLLCYVLALNIKGFAEISAVLIIFCLVNYKSEKFKCK